MNEEALRLILGLKLKSLRREKGLSLSSIAQEAGLSVSYLSEIEHGRKYPKPEKLLLLARALGVSFDDLVSLKLGDELEALSTLLGSQLLRDFPFDHFGLGQGELIGLMTEEPVKAAAFLRTLLEIGKTHDLRVEHFYFSALRSYQKLNGNYFEDIEQSAASFAKEHGWSAEQRNGEFPLREVLEKEHRYRIDLETLPAHPHLKSFRSIFVPADPPRLLVNGNLLPAQRAFIFARELGYRHLALEERALTSSWLRAESFDQVLNNYKASYFAGALMIDRDSLLEKIGELFGNERWDPQRFLGLIEEVGATPEMLFYRLTELAPAHHGLKELFFLRFSTKLRSNDFRLTKELNMSRVPVPHGLGPAEHYCRRWAALKLLGEREVADREPTVLAQRARFIDDDAEFFVLAVARPLALSRDMAAGVSVGFLLDDHFKRTVRFWDDPAIPRVDVNLTCERCPLEPEACRDRVAPPYVFRHEQEQRLKEQALDELIRREGAKRR